ncbi:hypothetical protein OC834_006867 [Tilletia horrida]|nr:hypothetical protein OC834_006867 [Tilletia horrida]
MVAIGPYTDVAPIGLGLMSLTWRPVSAFQPDEETFAVIKAAIDNAGADRVLLNAGTFYGPSDDAYANLKLLRRFFDKYPQLKDKVILNVKGGAIMKDYIEKDFAGLRFSARLEDLRNDLVELRRVLGSDEGGIQVHVYEPARRDLNFSVEDTIKNLHTLQKEGLFEHISLSEVGAETINTAAKTAKELGTQIVSVELEYSPFRTDIEQNGVFATCKEHGIPILAYSPVGKGFLGGQLKSRDDLPPGDIRAHQDLFSEENFPKNVKLAETFASLAASHTPPCTPAQLALAWLLHQGTDTAPIIPIPGTTNAKRVLENMGAKDVKLDGEDGKALSSQIGSFKAHGERYNAHARASGTLFS